MRKEKMLIVVNSLNIGGAEKSLISFLNELDYEKYEVYLQMFNIGGEFLQILNKKVRVLPSLKFINFCNNNVIRQLSLLNIKYLLSRIKLTFALRVKNNMHDSQIYWKICKKCYEYDSNEYDVAIAWGQGLPTYYIVDKVNAHKKIAWINVDYEKAGYNKLFDSNYYEKVNKIVLVSNDLKSIFSKVYPEYATKFCVIYDINSYKTILEMAKEKINLEFSDEIKLVTVGRLVQPKGYDLAIKSAKILKDTDLNFKWYFVGDGPERNKIEEMISQYELNKEIILLGAQMNPYKYINMCDIYVQTSKFEGYCLTLAEARMLNKPIVTTNFDVVYDQMKDEKNGLIVNMDSADISQGILRLVNNENLKNKLVNNLKNEKKGNAEEILKLYDLIK